MPNPDDFLKTNDFLGEGREIFTGGPRPSTTPNPEISPEGYNKVRNYAELGDVTLPYDMEMLNEMAYQSQSWGGNLAKGAVRTAGKVLTEILSIPGYLVAAGTGLTGNGWDNVWLEGMRGLDEGIKNQMPLYMSKSVEEGGIVDKLGDTAWWGSTGADGVGFMLSMMLPGQALKLAGLGGKLARGVGAVGRGLEAISGTAVTAAELTNAGNQLGKMGRLAKTFKGLGASASFASGAESVASVATNTLIEASAEANNTYRNIRDQLMAKGGMGQEQIDKLAGNAATNVFGTNLVILALSNSLLEKFVFKGFDPGASATSRLKNMNLFAAKSAGEGVEATGKAAVRSLDDLAQRNWKQWMGPIGTRLVSGAVSEGLWEEGMQTSVEQYVTNQALQGNLTSFTESLVNTPYQWMNNLTAMEGTKESKEFYEAAVLGGVLGGGMTAVTTGQGIREEERMLFGSPEVKMRTSKTGKVMDKLTGRTPKEADPGMVAKLRGVVEASTLKTEDLIEKDEQGNFIRDETTGFYKVNQKTVDAVSEAGRSLAQEIANLAVAEEELKTAKTMGYNTEEIESRLDDIKNRKEMFLMNPYINLEGGSEVFKEHIDQILDKMEAAKVKEQDGAPHAIDPVTRNMDKQRMLEKVERLSKLNKVIADTHYSNLSYLQDEEGTEEEKQNFYASNLWDKKQTGAYLNHKEELITDLQRKQKRLEAEIDRQQGEKGFVNNAAQEELKNLNKRLEKEMEGMREAKIMYERMFDKQYQLKQFNRMKEVKKLREEKQKRVEGEIEKRENQTLEDIFQDAGYDVTTDQLDDIIINATENEDIRATQENMYADQKEVKPKSKQFKIKQNGNEIAITQTVYDQNGNPIEAYLSGVDEQGKFVFSQYNGLPKQVTPEGLAKLFFSDIRYNYTIEEKEQRDNRKKQEVLQERKKVLDEERDRLVNDLVEISNKHNAEMAKIQKQLDKVQKAIDALEERGEKLEKEKQEAEQALENLRSLLATKQEINKNNASETLKNEIREIEKEVKKLKNFVLSREEMLLKNQNLIAENRNKIKDVRAKYNALEINIKEINRYQQKIEELKEDYEKGAFEQFSDVEDEMFNVILEDYFKVVPNSEDVKTIKEALGKFNNHLKDFLRLFDKKYTGLKEFMDKSEDRIQELNEQLEKEEKDLEKINGELNEMFDAIAEIDRLIERLGPISSFSSTQADAVEKLNNEKAQKIMKSNLYKEQIQKLRDNTRSIRKTILQLEAEKKTVHELFSIFKGIKGYQEDIYSVVGAVLDERKRLSDQDKVEMENQVSDSEPEPDSEQLNERYYDPAEFRSYERNVLDEYTLTGLHVMFDTKNNVPVDRRDAEGNLVFNDNPQAQTWFGFTEDILTLKKDRDDYTYGVYNLQNANEAQREAILNSFAYSGTLSEAEKKNALFIFVKDKNDNFVKQNGNFVFAPFRANFTNVFLTESHVLTYYSSLTNEEKESFEKLNIQEQKNAIRAFFDARYVDWLNRLRNDIDNGQDVDLKMKSPVLSGGYLNFKRDKDGNPEKNQVKDSLPEYFENGKIKPNTLKVSTSPFVEINGIKYRLPKGAAYIEPSNIPVILNQNLLSEDNIETVIALYGMLSDDFNASIDGVPILPKTGGGESLIKNLLNHGDDIDSNGQRLSGSRIFVNRGKVKFSIGNSPLTEINLKSLKEYTELNAIQRNEDQQKRFEELEQEITPLKDFLKTKYTFVNKNLVGRTASIPSLKGGTVVVQKQDYNDFLFKNVLTTNLAKANEPRFLQVNLVVDESSFNPVVEFVPKTEEEKTKPEQKTPEVKPAAAQVERKDPAPATGISKDAEEIKKEIEELKNINGVYNFETQQKGANFIILLNGENVGLEVSEFASLPNLKVKFEQYVEKNIPDIVYDIISNKYFSGLTKNQVFDTWYNNLRSTNVDITKEIENRIAGLEQKLTVLTQEEVVEDQPAVEPTNEAVEELTSAAAQVDDDIQQEQENEINEEVSNVSNNLVNALEDIGVEEQKPVEQKATIKGRREVSDDEFLLFGEDVEEETVLPTKEEDVLPVAPTPSTPALVATPINIEQQRADIERKRQEALKYEIEEVTTDSDFLHEKGTWRVINTKENPNNERLTFIGKTKQEVIDKINAKYDAELAALEGKPSAPVTPAAPVAEPSVPETQQNLDKIIEENVTDDDIKNAEGKVEEVLSNLDSASKEQNDIVDKVIEEEVFTNEEKQTIKEEKQNNETEKQYVKRSFRQHLNGSYKGRLSGLFKRLRDKLRQVLLSITLIPILITHTTGNFGFFEYVALTKNYSERHFEIKPDLKFENVTFKLEDNKLKDVFGTNRIAYKSGYATNQIINLKENTFEARNRNDKTPVENAVGITTNLFKPFQEVNDFKPELPRKDDATRKNPPVIAFNKKTGEVKAGNLKDFNSDWKVSETFTIPLDFKLNANGKLKTVYHNQAERNVPVTTDAKGNQIPFPIGINTKESFIDPTAHNTFGHLEGGKVIMVVGNYQVQINGGFADIYNAWKKLKESNPEKEITAYLLDNGSYNLPILKDNGVVTSQDLKDHTLRNKDGGTSLILKQKVSAEEANYPHGFQKIETNNFRKDSLGNKVENQPKVIVLHHTGDYADGVQQIIKEFTAPNGNSAHYVIGKDGKIYQFNNGSYVLFHAGKSLFNGNEDLNAMSIGIEIEGDSEKRDFTKNQYESLVALVHDLARTYGISIENIIDHKTIRANYLKAHSEDKETKEKTDLNETIMKNIMSKIQKSYPKTVKKETKETKESDEIPLSVPLTVLAVLQGLNIAINRYQKRKGKGGLSMDTNVEKRNKIIDTDAAKVILKNLEESGQVTKKCN